MMTEFLIKVGEFVTVSQLAWVKSENYWDVKFDILEKVKLSFDEKNISIPYPQINIQMNQNDIVANSLK